MDYTKIVNKIKPSISIVFSILDNKILSKGSGFIYQKNGVLVTCNHVVKDTKAKIVIKFPDKEEFINATIIIRDEEHDLALLRFEDKNERKPLNSCEKSLIKEGMEVIFAGYPLALSNLTTHQGILSSIFKDPAGVDIYLIDGTVNAGNSGCPLMTPAGKVIGVVNAKRREKNDLLEKVENLGVGAVSIHSLDLIEVIDAIIKNTQLGIGYAIPSSYIPESKE